VERTFLRLAAPFDAKHLQIMVDYGFYLIETITWAIQNPEKNHLEVAEGELPPDDVQRLRAREVVLLKMAVVALGMAKRVIALYPRKLGEEYLTPEYAFKYFGQKRPDLIPVLRTPEGYKWLRGELMEVRRFMYGSS